MSAAWNVTVRGWDRYGRKIVTRTPATIIAADKAEVTQKVRAMFNATYDDFRKFWSHDWVLVSVAEMVPAPSGEAAEPTTTDRGE